MSIHTCNYKCMRPGCIEKQRDELLLDALRYRWLRNKGFWPVVVETTRGKDLDATIDFELRKDFDI